MVRKILLLVLFALSHNAFAAETAPPPEPAGMHALFNGQNLDGWDGDARLWSVRDGAIHG